MNSTIQYNFTKEQDLGFYILNAVCHDWIHDFNNYERMGKILNYIMQLVPSRELVDVSTSLSAAVNEDTQIDTLTSSSPAVMEQKPIITEEDRNILDTTNEENIPNDTPTLDPNVLSVKDLYDSQVDQYLEDTSLTSENTQIITDSLPQHQSIINNSIKAFNDIKKNTESYNMTRGNVRKINILQQLGEFIGECKLLIISKISSIIGIGGIGGIGGMRANEGSKKIIGGASAIDVIKIDDITLSINNIIKEIDETTNISQDIKKNLKNIFELINELFINFNIQGISPLEKFNNSIITEITSMFIVNKCENINIQKESVLYLKTLLHPLSLEVPSQPFAKSIYDTKPISLYRRDFLTPQISSSSSSLTSVAAGGGFSAKVYTDNVDKWSQLDEKISLIKSSGLNEIYTGKSNFSSDIEKLYNEYKNFIGEIQDQAVLKLIIGQQMYNVKTKQIVNFYLSTKLGGRNYIKNAQKLVDTINDFIFDKVINTYEDIRNKSQARLQPTSETTRISGEARGAVQQISKLVAKKTLELTGYLNATGLDTSKLNLNGDLTKQANIIMEIGNNGKGYTTVDNQLISYFNSTYGNNQLFKSGENANKFIIEQFKNCNNTNCRVINNAIPNGDVKNNIQRIVVCPTSSVCDGMGAFGSCINPTSTQKEYFNMDFNISVLRSNNFYQGSTIIKPNKQAVNINYGFKFNNLEIYNFLDININTQPIVLQANYTFKGVINRIIEIWKSASTITTIDGLWNLLEYNDYFLSILKLGSQKAIGDIFQEINSTLNNGGYSVNTNVNNKKTFGLMGDRPSGVRVLKLLKDFDPKIPSGVNPNATGGYIGGDTSLIYIPINFNDDSKKRKQNDITNDSNKSSRRIGGKNTKKKIKLIKKTYKKNNVNKSIKKRKHKNRKTKKINSY